MAMHEVVSNGEDVIVEWSDRSFGGARKVMVKVDGASGDVSLGDPAPSGSAPLKVAAADGSIALGGRVSSSASSQKVPDPGNAGAISVASDGVCNMVSAAAETRTLANPSYIDQRLVLCMDTDGGDIVLTVASVYDQTAHTVITFNDAGDMVELVACTIGGARRWRLVANLGAVLS